MPNYKESTISGSKWIRARRVVLDNPIDAIPRIVFEEEQVVQAGDVVIKQPVAADHYSQVKGEFTDPATVFDMLDPETDAVVGTATYAQFYAMLYSMYKHLAIKRDDVVAALAAMPATPVYVAPPPPPEPVADAAPAADTPPAADAPATPADAPAADPAAPAPAV